MLDRIEEELQMKEVRKSRVKKQPIVKRKVAYSFSEIGETKIKKPRNKYELDDSESQSDDDLNPSPNLTDSDSVDYSEDFDKENDFMNDLSSVGVKSFVLVKFATKKKLRHYVGCVTDVLKDSDEITVSFLRRHGTNFTYPSVPDIGTVPAEDVILHLPNPTNIAGTARTASLYKFSIDLSMYNVC